MMLPIVKEPQNNADILYNAVAENCEFYVDTNNETYFVCRSKNNYVLVYLSAPDDAKQFFIKLYFTLFNSTIKKADVLTAYETVCAMATKYSRKIPVCTRAGYCNGSLYYDLATVKGDIVKISPSSVDVLKKSVIDDLFFYKDVTMLPQVEPKDDEYTIFDFIKDFLNVDNKYNVLLAVYLCAAFIPHIKHPILIAEGEKGAAKTTLLRYLSKIINPVTKDVLVLPKKEDNLITALSNNHFSAFDNIERLPDEFSRIICQSATGGTLVKRKLYSDNREITINIKRIVALNGINLNITKDDLLDRAIMIYLNRISEKDRCPEEVLDNKFESKLPYLMNDIFRTLSKALQIYPNVNLDEYPRMADFSRYGYAIAEAIGEGYGDIFIEAYKDNIKHATQSIVERDPVLNSMLHLAESGSWRGTMTELLKKLQTCYRELYTAKNLPLTFPDNPIALARKLNIHKHELEKLGVNYETGHSKERFVVVGKNSDEQSTISTNSTIENAENTKRRKNLLEDDD